MLTTARNFLLLGFLPLSAAGQSANANRCEAPAPIWEQVLDATTRIRYEQNGRYVSQEQVSSERRRRITALLEKYPDNFFVRRAYLTHSKEGVANEQLIAEFKSYAEAHPADAGAQHLYGEALTGRRTPEAIKVLEEVIRKEPSFPWPYRQLVVIYQSPRFTDRAKLQQNAEAFVERCPTTRIAASLASGLSADKLRLYTKQLRAYLAGKKDEDSVSTYYHLWRLEFKATPAPEHQSVRQRIAEDPVWPNLKTYENCPRSMRGLRSTCLL
ncbi:MAG: hypothetical protein IT168_18760 [Bryobacterales bacterium]|nr:hypothetical protein [Bryobacterales bacterium]